MAKVHNQRGQALLEALPALGILLVFVSGLLLAGYLIFAKQWIQYQGEQGLYCLAVVGFSQPCRTAIQTRLARFLPWTDSSSLRFEKVRRGGEDLWRVEIQWRYGQVSLDTRKELSIRQILANRDLRW